ncbi:hypothetical protein G6N05_11845 [Flavobacterium sp. F372]|uniref:HEAT repeat domain-containing protein n=1 Tax=Flavobacterium bernardetii TaxID=2813823 RepID=A0ABR7IZ74_9FLAO|nr:hypothetical protein [Flavobacterium bernardetii]MBC5835081.1 hypothetical protein [Flavobacterium bernardetii]NHF70803.1 hypothetical protein [Flavobacterium bernardetii]
MNKILVFSLFFLSLNTFSQNTKKDSLAIQKIVKKYNPKNEIQKVITISDSDEVNLISNYIVKKNTEKAKADDKANIILNSSIGKRYIKGDKSLISEIVKVLESNDGEKIISILKDLDLDYSERKKGLNLEQNILNSIVKLLNNPDFEHRIIQFLGFNNVVGSEKILEERFLSGKSKDNDRIFYWLASNFNNKKALDYIHKSYFDKKFDVENMDWFLSSFSEYIEKEDVEAIQKIREIAYDYLQKKPIQKSDLENKLQLSIVGGRATTLTMLEVLIKTKDNRVTNILNDFLTSLKGTKYFNEVLLNTEKLLFFTFSSEKKREFIVKNLNSKDDFFDTLDVIKEENQFFKDPNICKQILLNFEKFNFTDEFEFYRLINHFEDLEKEMVINTIKENISNDSLKEYLIKRYSVSLWSMNEINDFLLKNEIISTEISNEKIENYKKKEFSVENLNTIEACLDISEISLNFDTEVGEFPVDYTVLLNDFAKISKNKIQDIKSYLQYKVDYDNGEAYYQFLVSYKNKCYVLIPENFGDWYDIESFEKLLNVIISDTNCKEEFVSISTGGQDAYYIFGEKDKVSLIRNTFYPEYNNEK